MTQQSRSLAFNKGAENLHPHKNLHMGVSRSFIHNCQDLQQARRPSVAKWIKTPLTSRLQDTMSHLETTGLCSHSDHGTLLSTKKKWATLRDFIFLGSKITADGDCSHEIKRCLLLGRKVMTNLDSIFKSRDITLPTNVRLVKAMVFPVVMYGCESWTVKKAERWRIDAFEL